MSRRLAFSSRPPQLWPVLVGCVQDAACLPKSERYGAQGHDVFTFTEDLKGLFAGKWCCVAVLLRSIVPRGSA